MKYCPQCQSVFDDDNTFCVSDGTTLIMQAAADPSRFVVSVTPHVSDEVPTQYVPIKPLPTVAAPVQPSNNGLLYAVIGCLVTIIVIGVGVLLYVAVGGKDGEAAANNSNGTPSQSNSGNNVGSSDLTRVRNTEPANAPANLPVNPMPMQPAANAPAANAVKLPTLEKRFNRTYSGTMDNSGVEMDLNKNGSSLSGKVRPYGRYADIYVDGSVDNDGSFYMDEKSDIGVVTGTYRGRMYPDGSMTGTWSKPDGSKPKPINLRRQ